MTRGLSATVAADLSPATRRRRTVARRRGPGRHRQVNSVDWRSDHQSSAEGDGRDMRGLIVGAGIAGPTLAYWLQRLGHQPTLVECAPELRRGGYLVDFWGAGFDVAERMGIVPELRRRGYHLLEARTVDRGGRRIASFEPSAFVGSGDRYVTIARSDLAAAVFGASEGC